MSLHPGPIVVTLCTGMRHFETSSITYCYRQPDDTTLPAIMYTRPLGSTTAVLMSTSALPKHEQAD